MNARTALRSYARQESTAQVEGESPEKLIVLLLQKGCVLLKQAQHSLAADDLAVFHESTTHCMQILVALRGLLDFEKGGEVAIQLATTYDAITSSLFKAKRERSSIQLNKLHAALSELLDGWTSIV